MIISPTKLRKYAKGINPNMRISKRYIIGLEIQLLDKIEAHIKRNNGKKTLMDDVFLGLPARKKIDKGITHHAPSIAERNLG